LGTGYGWPSSHSQFMVRIPSLEPGACPSNSSQGYFSSFLITHIYFRHRFGSTGFKILDQLTRLAVYFAIIGLAGTVCYSRLVLKNFMSRVDLRDRKTIHRYYLNYHTPPQILWGYGIGLVLGSAHYFVTELWPTHQPDSSIGRLRRWILSSTPATWLGLKDGWAVWDDGGHGDTYQRWRLEWDAKGTRSSRLKSQ
jgi:dolichyldiphosphatase